MQVLWEGKHEQFFGESDPETGDIAASLTYFWEVVICMNCETPNIFQTTLSSEVDYEYFTPDTETLYPNRKHLINLPKAVQKAYDAAQAIYPIDAGAFVVRIAVTLEAMCKEQNAKKGSLYQMLGDLSKNQIIPKLLFDSAQSLRLFRNISAHDNDIEVTRYDAEILKDICDTILEYVYELPHVISRLQRKIKEHQEQG